MTTYYQLRCSTCDELFKPLCATTPDELLHPDYDDPDSGGYYNLESLMESLRLFHDTHKGHALKGRRYGTTRIGVRPKPLPLSPRGETPEQILNRLAARLNCEPRQVADRVLRILEERQKQNG